MAILLRRGPYEQFDPTRLLPGELALVLSGDPSTMDGRALYVCTAAGSVKRMATFDDLYQLVSDIEGEITEDLHTIAEVAAQDARDAAAEAARYGERIDYLESQSLDYVPLVLDVDKLKECCDESGETLVGLAGTLAEIANKWQYACGAFVAPNAEKLSVTGTTATIPGTVEGTTFILD